MERPLSTRLFQAKTQDATGLLAGLEQFAAGGLTEMLEIFGRAGIGREDFEHRTRGKRLQRPPRLQHRQWAEQPGGVEGGVHRNVTGLRHFRAPRQQHSR